MMNSPIHLTDEEFNLDSSGDRHLLIHIADQSYSCAIIDKERSRLGVVVKKKFGQQAGSMNSSEKLEIILSDNGYLKQDFQSVKISVETTAFTFVPEELYSDDDLPQYTKFMGASPDSVVLSSNIRPYGIANICAIDAAFGSKLRSVFRDPLIVSQANPFIAGIYSRIISGNPSGLFLNCCTDRFEAAVVQSGTLEFYNIFRTRTTDEFNYYLLSLISQLALDRSMAVTLSGEIQQEDENFMRLSKYFDNISFSDSRIMRNGSDVFKRLPSHEFFSLMSLDLCE